MDKFSAFYYSCRKNSFSVCFSSVWHGSCYVISVDRNKQNPDAVMGCQPREWDDFHPRNPGSGSGKQSVEQEEITMKSLTLYRPGVLENALSGFDRYMDSFFGDNFLSPSDRIFSRLPLVDVRETEKSYVLEAELAGFDEKDIQVRLEGNTLTIESKKLDDEKKEASGADRNYLIRERRVSSFSRSFKLPENADNEGVAASFKNGVLSLEISKKAEAQARTIQITKD